MTPASVEYETSMGILYSSIQLRFTTVEKRLWLHARH
jgi:hypothetical protein